jgi:hypothetical protein
LNRQDGKLEPVTVVKVLWENLSKQEAEQVNHAAIRHLNALGLSPGTHYLNVSYESDTGGRKAVNLSVTIVSSDRVDTQPSSPMLNLRIT